jgi:hypothetical protein
VRGRRTCERSPTAPAATCRSTRSPTGTA